MHRQYVIKDSTRALVQWFWQKAGVQEAMNSNPSNVDWMSIFTLICCIICNFCLKKTKINLKVASGGQFDQIWRFFGLWATFQSLWQQVICPILLNSQTIFVKVSKSFIFLVKSFLGNFYRHLAIFIWSHWWRPILKTDKNPCIKILLLGAAIDKSSSTNLLLWV